MSFGEQFLQFPDLFPARLSGEPWGAETIVLDVAGPVRFSGLTTAQLAAARERFGADRSADLEGNDQPLEVRVARMSPDEFIRFDQTNWIQTVEMDQEPGQIRIAAYDFIALIRIEPKLSAALWTCENEGVAFPSVFENFYRIFAAYQALNDGGVLLHSAGVVLDGRALLFYGHSNAGKTTLTRLALENGNRVLSDDLNLILGPKGGHRVRRIPFAGDLGRADVSREIYPLGGLFHLRKGETHLDRLSPATAFASIVGSAPFVNQDPYRYERLANVVEDLLDTYDPLQLTFSREGDFWNLLQ